LDGTLRIQSHSDNPARFQAGEPLDVAGQSWTVASCHDLPDGHALLRLEGLIDPNAARRLSGEWVLAAEDAAPQLPSGEYYHYQLVGLAVVTEYGENLGHVREILETGSNDVYVVASDTGDEVLLPAIEQVVKRIDLASREIVVHLIDGLR
jgi:16S rRNA processing protein RimM